MKQIYFIRHGLSEMNVAGLMSGHTNTPLTETGQKQAMLAGKQAKKQGLVFDIILSSDLDRAHQTAKLFAQEIDYLHHKIVTHEIFRERHFGQLEGKPFNFTYEEYRSNPFILDTVEGIETITDLHHRAKKIYDMLLELEHNNILVVSHGAIGRALRRVAENKTLHDDIESFENATLHRLI